MHCDQVAAGRVDLQPGRGVLRHLQFATGQFARCSWHCGQHEQPPLLSQVQPRPQPQSQHQHHQSPLPPPSPGRNQVGTSCWRSVSWPVSSSNAKAEMPLPGFCDPTHLQQEQHPRHQRRAMAHARASAASFHPLPERPEEWTVRGSSS